MYIMAGLLVVGCVRNLLVRLPDSVQPANR
jgi:hypothetical protein